MNNRIGFYRDFLGMLITQSSRKIAKSIKISNRLKRIMMITIGTIQ